MEWLRGLGLLDTFEELDAFEGLSAASRGVMFVPAQSGLGCPHWDRSARGLWIGMNCDFARRSLPRGGRGDRLPDRGIDRRVQRGHALHKDRG